MLLVGCGHEVAKATIPLIFIYPAHGVIYRAHTLESKRTNHSRGKSLKATSFTSECRPSEMEACNHLVTFPVLQRPVRPRASTEPSPPLMSTSPSGLPSSRLTRWPLYLDVLISVVGRIVPCMLCVPEAEADSQYLPVRPEADRSNGASRGAS